MTLETGPTSSASLVDRVKSILLQPGVTWTRIDAEPATVRGLFTGYTLILAAIGPVCRAIGMVVFGVGVPGIAMYHANPIGALLSAVVGYGLALAAVFVLGLIIDALAPTFGGQKNQVQAMKVAIYGSTAAWIAGVFQIIPMLGVLAIVGLYSLYLLYRGLPILMKTTADKAMGYTALVVVCDIVLVLVIAALTAPLAMVGAMSTGGLSTLGGPTGTMQVGGAAVDLGKLQAAGAQMQAQAAAMQASAAATAGGGGSVTTSTTVTGTPGVAPAALQALLPASLNGFVRGDVSAESTGAAGMNASHAQARYARGAAHMEVEITDMAAMGGLAGLAGAFNVNSSKQTATGYEKMSTQGGRMTTEEYDTAAKHGKYSVLAGSRFMIAAEGDNVSMDDLKSAVNAVGVERVEHLAHS